MPVAMMKLIWPRLSKRGDADHAMRRRLPSRRSHWFSKVEGEPLERRRSKWAMAAGMSALGISMSHR
jgi:hypothetical protein